AHPRQQIHHFAKDDSDLYDDGCPQFGSQGSNKMDSLTSTV
ncbi:hypothetical protein JCM8208_007403, partial [Rhodotorula glutinis]